ncbi:MAG: hypothetical protein WCA46_14215 [Actinocatenispora sp.]
MRRVLAFVTSRYGLAGLAALAVIVVVLIGRLAGLGGATNDTNTSPITGGQATGGTKESGAPNDAPTAAPSPVDPVVRPGQPGPLDVATDFCTSYLKSDGPPKVWRTALTRYATKKLAQQISTMDPVTVPAHERTGPAKLADHGAVWADVTLPTDEGTLVYRLVSKKGTWLVDGIDWDPRR